MRYDIATYGASILRRKAVPISDVNTEIKRLADNMLETMYVYKGVGLAAEQVGRTDCICVIDIPLEIDGQDQRELLFAGVPLPMPLIMVNPEILEKAGKHMQDEGCLSFPEIYAPVDRASEVAVAFTDLKGNRVVFRARNLLARAIQHELDHLSGVLLVDRMSPIKKISLAGRLRRLKQETESGLRSDR